LNLVCRRIEAFCITAFPAEEPDIVRHLPEALSQMENLGLIKTIPCVPYENEGGLPCYQVLDFTEAKNELKERWDLLFD